MSRYTRTQQSLQLLLELQLKREMLGIITHNGASAIILRWIAAPVHAVGFIAIKESSDYLAHVVIKTEQTHVHVLLVALCYNSDTSKTLCINKGVSAGVGNIILVLQRWCHQRNFSVHTIVCYYMYIMPHIR